MTLVMRELLSERSSVGGDRYHVLKRQLGDGGRHLLGCYSGARAALNVIELAHDVTRRTAGQWRRFVQAFQIGPMAGCAGNGFARTSCCDERLTFLDAA